MRHRVVMVVPCYNEASRLQLDRFRAYAGESPDTVFLFVDDGSTDGTAKLLAQEARDAPNLARVLSLPENRGKAEAVRLGLTEAIQQEAEIVGYWDADLATPLDELTPMVGLLQQDPGLEGVLGSRVMLLGHSVRRRTVRHYLGRFFATGASLALRLPVYDTQCGAKVFRASTELADCLVQPFRTRWIFDVELLGRLQGEWGAKAEEKLVEYPVRTWEDIEGSTLSAVDYVSAGWDLLRIWRRLARERIRSEGSQ